MYRGSEREEKEDPDSCGHAFDKARKLFRSVKHTLSSASETLNLFRFCEKRIAKIVKKRHSTRGTISSMDRAQNDEKVNL